MVEKEERRSPIVKLQKIHPLGSSYAIVIPKDWFDANKINPETIEKLLIVADMDIRIVNPQHEKEVYEEIAKVTKDAKIGETEEAVSPEKEEKAKES